MHPTVESPAARSSGVLGPRVVAEQFAALLFAEALKPLANSLGFYGDLVVGFTAQTAARSERDGLSGLFERYVSAAEQ